jgi:hypothetical protein
MHITIFVGHVSSFPSAALRQMLNDEATAIFFVLMNYAQKLTGQIQLNKFFRVNLIVYYSQK